MSDLSSMLRSLVWSLCICRPMSFGFVLVQEAKRAAFVSETRLASSTGGPPSPGGGKDGSSGSWEDFFRENESEDMLRAREYFNENALPINFNKDGESVKGKVDKEGKKEDGINNSALIRSPQLFASGNPGEDVLASNPYMAVVSNISPSDLISKFTTTAHPRVQNAVRSTVLSLIGGLPKMAFDTTTITTGQRLASLMFQLQMTGYMFKNAEYRLSLQQSLGSINDIMDGKKFLLEGSTITSDGSDEVPLGKRIKGKIRVRYGDSNDGGEPLENKKDKQEEDQTSGGSGMKGLEVEVDAAAYMSELTAEVQQLRDELMITRKEKEEALRKDLLVYIRTLPEKELRSLTGTISQDVLVAMKGLVNAVMSGIGEGEGQIGPDTVTEQSGEAMAQLCMWQLVVGYNLRTLEVREEMKKSLSASKNQNSSDPGPFDVPPGAFE